MRGPSGWPAPIGAQYESFAAQSKRRRGCQARFGSGIVAAIVPPANSPVSATFHIRKALPADLPALLRLEQASFTSDLLSRRRLRHWIGADNGILLVALEPGGALLGSCLVFTRRDSARARLYSIATDAAARGRGIGSALLRAAEEQTRERGRTHMYLEVAENNQAALSLYLREGYMQTGFLPGFYEDGRNALRLTKAL